MLMQVICFAFVYGSMIRTFLAAACAPASRSGSSRMVLRGCYPRRISASRGTRHARPRGTFGKLAPRLRSAN
jgi:hypothetical protein